jgi:hypothetical protein
MKTHCRSRLQCTHHHLSTELAPIGLGVMMFIANPEFLGAAAGFRRTEIEIPPPGATLTLEPGAIVILTAPQPARWSYDRPDGQIHNARAAAGHAAATVLEIPATEPRADIFLSAGAVVAAPVVAVLSGARAASERLPAAKLAEVQAGLVRALSNLTQPQLLAAAVVNVAPEHTRRRCWAQSTLAGQPNARDDQLALLLEPAVTELQLVRQGRNDESYTLRIKARVRWLRVPDYALLREVTFTYQTAPDLFLDWALNGGEPLARCTETGYRQIAHEIFADLAAHSGEAPQFVGAGRRALRPPSRLTHATIKKDIHAVVAPAQGQFAQHSPNNRGTIYLLATPEKRFAPLPQPLTRDEAADEAMADMLWRLNGLESHPNVFVALSAYAVMIPEGLYHQTLGPIRNEFRRARQRATQPTLTAALQTATPSHELLNQLAQHLEARDFDNVVRLDAPAVAAQFAKTDPAESSTVPTQPTNTRPKSINAGDKVLTVEIRKTTLVGAAAHESKLAIQVEARATVTRGADGQTLHQSTVVYRGKARSRTQWAAQDGELLRAEVQNAGAQISEVLVEELIRRQLLQPNAARTPVLVGN